MYVAVIIIAVTIFFIILLYNEMLSKRNKLLKAYSSLDVMLKKRYDLIPNLIAIIKEYNKYEEKTFEKVVSLRNRADNADSVKDMEAISNEYRSFINNVSLLSESYPVIKANENFIQFQKILNDIEEQISAARRTYNAHVENYDTFISLFPINLFAKLFGFKKYDYFEAKENEKVEVKV